MMTCVQRQALILIAIQQVGAKCILLKASVHMFGSMHIIVVHYLYTTFFCSVQYICLASTMGLSSTGCHTDSLTLRLLLNS